MIALARRPQVIDPTCGKPSNAARCLQVRSRFSRTFQRSRRRHCPADFVAAALWLLTARTIVKDLGTNASLDQQLNVLLEARRSLDYVEMITNLQIDLGSSLRCLAPLKWTGAIKERYICNLDYATTTAPYYTLELQEDGSKNYACTSCSRKYKSLPSVVQHYRHVHLRLRPKLRSCFLCEVKVPGHARAFHLEKEHGIPAPTCNACGKKFAYPFQVLRHQKNDHMGEKKFGCSECELRFTSQANLSQHMIKHSSVRVHKCEICEKSFKWKKNLRTHIMMHMDERRHVCPVCKDAFVQQSSLSYHITKRHPEYV